MAMPNSVHPLKSTSISPARLTRVCNSSKSVSANSGLLLITSVKGRPLIRTVDQAINPELPCSPRQNPCMERRAYPVRLPITRISLYVSKLVPVQKQRLASHFIARRIYSQIISAGLEILIIMPLKSTVFKRLTTSSAIRIESSNISNRVSPGLRLRPKAVTSISASFNSSYPPARITVSRPQAAPVTASSRSKA